MKFLKYTLYLLIFISVSIAQSFEISGEMRAYLDTARIIEGGFPSGMAEDMSLPFADYMNSHWREIIDAIEEIAPTQREQIVISATAELLPANNYLDFVKSFLEKFEEGSVHRNVITNTTLNPGALRYGFFEYNFNHPKVREILLYGKELFSDDERLNERIDYILDGRGKERIDDWISMTGKSPPELLIRDDDSNQINNAKLPHSSDERKSISKIAPKSSEKSPKWPSYWWLWSIGVFIVIGGVYFVFRHEN